MRSSLSHRDRFRIRFPYSSRHTRASEQIVVWRWKMLLVMSFLLLLSIVFFFLYSSFFRIKYVEITTLKYIPQHEVEDAVDSFLSKRRWYLFKQNNYFIFSKDKLALHLFDSFQFADIHIEKIAPDMLLLAPKEDIAVFLIADSPDAKLYDLIDHTANLIQTLEKVSIHPELPKVYILPGQTFDRSLARLVLGAWDRTNTKGLLFKITMFRFDGVNLEAETDRGFVIRMSTQVNADQQINNLDSLLTAFEKSEPLPLEYIELRFGEKVYVK